MGETLKRGGGRSRECPEGGCPPGGAGSGSRAHQRRLKLSADCPAGPWRPHHLLQEPAGALRRPACRETSGHFGDWKQEVGAAGAEPAWWEDWTERALTQNEPGGLGGDTGRWLPASTCVPITICVHTLLPSPDPHQGLFHCHQSLGPPDPQCARSGLPQPNPTPFLRQRSPPRPRRAPTQVSTSRARQALHTAPAALPGGRWDPHPGPPAQCGWAGSGLAQPPSSPSVLGAKAISRLSPTRRLPRGRDCLGDGQADLTG